MTTPEKNTESKIRSKIALSAPWDRLARGNMRMQESHFMRDSNDAEAADEAEWLDRFIEERSEVHAIYIRESEKTKRFGYGLSAALLALACVVPVFAPAGRELMSYWFQSLFWCFQPVRWDIRKFP
jgi:hypothetical protein